MSLPGLVAQPLSQVYATVMNPIDGLLALFNTNPYFIGIMMLLLNFGGRFLVMEVSKEQELFFQNPWTRRALIFVVLFVATRSIAVAFWMSIAAIIIIGYLFNENSALCLFAGGRGGSTCAAKDDDKKSSVPKPGLTPEEADILRRLSEKNMRYSKVPEKREREAEAAANEIYMANMQLLRGVNLMSSNQ